MLRLAVSARHEGAALSASVLRQGPNGGSSHRQARPGGLHDRTECLYAPGMSDLTADFYRQNEWASLQLIGVCRGLSDEQLGATAVGTYGSIRATLRHLVSSEANYAFRLGEGPIRRLPPDEPWPGFDVLAEMVSVNAAVFGAAARGDANRIIRLDPDTDPYDSEAAVVLVQAFNHATEHRSQICTILTTLGIEPPDMSGWEWGLADGRMRKV